MSLARELAVPSLKTIDEAAEILRCHERTIRRMVRAGDLVAFKVANRLLFNESDLAIYVKESRVGWR